MTPAFDAIAPHPDGVEAADELVHERAPVAVQSIWSFNMAQQRTDGGDSPLSTDEARQRALMANVNTCHVWAEDSEHVAGLRDGGTMDVPLWITKRFGELGRDPATWRS